MTVPGEPQPTRRAFLNASAVGLGSAAISLFAPARRAVAEELSSLRSIDDDDELFEALAVEYDLAADVVYLNHASIGTVPRVVRQARERYTRTCESNPWLYTWGGAWDDASALVRDKSALLLGCRGDEVAVTRNTTEAFNILARGLELGPSDEVLFSSLNHVGASACWQHEAEHRGFAVRRFEFPARDTASLTPDDVTRLHIDALSDRTRVLVLPHIDNLVGLRHPVRRVARAARERGVEIVAVDGAQAVGMVPVDVSDLGVDFYATSAHKWLQTPKGLGLMYVRQEVQDRIRPLFTTWGRTRFAGSARRYEDYGTRDIATILSLGDAIDFQGALRSDRRLARLEVLRQRSRARVEAHAALRWRSPERFEQGASLFAIEVDGRSTAEIFQTMLEGGGFVFRAFAGETLNAIRISPNVFTSEADLDAFFDALGVMLE
ncbi:MAG: aminotransferase class V-fold PLP-dependent enzyme [Planctomycetota bacterium]